MAGPIQKAINETVMTSAALAIAGKKGSETKRQAEEKAASEAQAEEKAAKTIQTEALETALESDLIKMGADPASARAFMNARKLGLDTKNFGMIRKNGKFAGTYSSLAEKLSKDSLADTLSSKVINDKGFAERIIALGATRRGRVDALVKATEGGKK